MNPGLSMGVMIMKKRTIAENPTIVRFLSKRLAVKFRTLCSNGIQLLRIKTLLRIIYLQFGQQEFCFEDGG